MDPRTVKPKLPVKVLVLSVAAGLFVLGFIVFANSNLFLNLRDARMTGVVVSKEFVPAQGTEQQITIGRDGKINSAIIEGEFILTVEVPQPDGSRKPYKVWMPNREQFDAVQVGDSFDVGPRLVK